MRLEQHKMLKALEGLLEEVEPPRWDSSRELRESIVKARNLARTKIRNRLRKLADSKSTFTAEKNGTEAFDTWQDGFKYATSLPANTEVVYFHRMTADVVFFHKAETIAKLEAALPEFEKMVKEVQDFRTVAQIQLA